MLRIILATVLAVLVSGCSASDGGDGSNANASEVDHGGWATSETVFTTRWNNLVKGVYKLSDFQGNRNSKDGAKATYLSGEVTSLRGIYINNIRDPHWFGAACGDTIAAAIGVSAEDADALARQTYANLASSGFGFGSLEYHGYTISMGQTGPSQAQLRSFCLVGPTDVVTRVGKAALQGS